jgi:hypothetical protein
LLPEGVNRIELHGLRVGGARADLRFERGDREKVGVEVLKVDGTLDILS